MRIDFLRPDSWEMANEAVLKNVPAGPSGTQVRVAKGLVGGLFETFNATASFLSHKKTIGVIEGQSWCQQAVLAPLLRDNHEIKTFAVASLQNPEGIIESIGTETSAFFFPEDHPITGEKFVFEALETLLTQKRIFSIRVSHHGKLEATEGLKPYSVRLCSIAPDLSAAFLGARYKTPPQMAPWQAWNVREVETQIKERLSSHQEDRAAVEKFEAGLGGGFKPVLATDSRVWDRAVVTSTNRAGEQVLMDLETLTGKSQVLGGAPAWADTAQLCRWNATMQDLSWWKTALTPDEIRGLVVLSIETLRHPAVQKYFSGAGTN